MFLLLALSICEEHSASSLTLLTGSSFRVASLRVRRETATVGGLVVGLAVTVLLRLARKPCQVGFLQSSPEPMSDASDDEDLDSSGEYGLRDAILMVTDDETMTDLPRVLREESGECESDEMGANAAYD
jgi:hypothetical protein